MTSAIPQAQGVLAGVGRVLRPALELYLDLHQHPELAGYERRTADRFATAIRAAGFGVSTGIGGHGVVGVLANGDGPTVMLRAELDALPVEERTGLPYASRARARDADGAQVPVMHACGHDLHLAAVAGTANLLASHTDHWRGTLVLAGQPAEETLTGARAMLADGLYERFPRPDCVLGQHVSPLPAGTIAHTDGPVIAASAAIDVVVHGHGGHAAVAGSTVSPLEIAAAVVARLRRIGRAGQDTPEAVTVNVGSLHAGVRANVVPDQARMSISVRSFSESGLADAVDVVSRIVRQECAAAASPAEPEIAVTVRSPAAANDRCLGAAVREAHQAVFGTSRVTAWPPTPIAEDFPLFGPAGADLYGGPAVPAVYWMIGGTGHPRASGPADPPVNHSPWFAPDPVPTLRTGIAALAAAAVCLLR